MAAPVLNDQSWPLLILFLSNTRSIINKNDSLELLFRRNRFVTNYSLMIITESSLHLMNPKTAPQLAGHTCNRQDRTSLLGKREGRGLCIYMHNDWCANSKIIAQHCNSELKAFLVLCRLFCPPQELTVVTVTIFCISPNTNIKDNGIFANSHW